MNDRETRLRGRIDELIDEREELRATIENLRKRLKAAHSRTRAAKEGREMWKHRASSHELKLAKARTRAAAKRAAA